MKRTSRYIINLVISVLILLPASATNVHNRDIKSLYARLDSLINVQGELTKTKQKKIEVIQSTLSTPGLTYAERYSINERLYDEYLAFKYDSAYKYVTTNMELARRENDMMRYNRSRLNLVHIVNVAGLFDEAENLLEKIDTLQLEKEDLINYYTQYSELYLFKAEFSQGTNYYDHYIAEAMKYRQKILRFASPESYPYIVTRASYIAQEKKYDEAIRLLEQCLPKYKSGDRNYSILTNTLAFFYRCKEDSQQQRRYLVLSAISDLEGSIRENNSLRELALTLFVEGDTELAYKCLNTSIEDANFYGTRLRSIQAAQLLPQILNAYQSGQEAQHRTTVVILIIISIASLLLILGIIVIAVLMKRYSHANRKVHKINDELGEVVKKLEAANGLMRESNKIKEEYIGRFLELSSTYIDKMEEQRKKENRLAREHDLPALFEELKSSRTNTENTRLFYKNFDSAFLNIYPHFVEEVNKLLMPEYRIIPKEGGERLTTELRIFALIRLGITDNQKIASILRSSITTIYTYRSKFKNRSVAKDEFEEQIKEINL